MKTPIRDIMIRDSCEPADGRGGIVVYHDVGDRRMDGVSRLLKVHYIQGPCFLSGSKLKPRPENKRLG